MEKNDLYKLIDNSIQNIKKNTLKKGEFVEAKVERILVNDVVASINNVYTAVIPKTEMTKESVNTLKEGDVIKVYVLKTEDELGNIVLSEKRTSTTQRWDLLVEAHKNDISLQVSVLEANNGGLLVSYESITGFIPASQLDPNKVYKLETTTNSKEELQKEVSKKLAESIGSKLTVKIVEVDKQKNRVIFSERLAMSDQSLEQRSQLLRNLKVGEVLAATVTAVTPYGIFVNASGIDGLVHVSEISWDKVADPSKYAKVGDRIKVKLIDFDSEGKRVAYSIKQMTEDPWEQAASDYKVGGVIAGEISSIEDYGVIVKLGGGITGLIHRTEMGDEAGAKEYKVGDNVEAIILTISPSDRKMGLSIKRLKSNTDADDEKGTKKTKKASDKPEKPKKAVLDIEGALKQAEEKSKK